MDAIVQLARNLLCCIKDLELFKESILYDSSSLTQFHGWNYHPYDKTTPLEALISIFQFYVFVTGVPNAFTLFWSSLGKLYRIYRILEQKNRSSIKLTVERLMLQSLFKEAAMSIKSAYIGFNVFFISFAFLWLSGNSWHVTETDIIGGLPALIHALTVMNICMVPLLYYMYKDARTQFERANVMEQAELKWEQHGVILEKDISIPVLEAITNWLPFWDSGAPVFGRVNHIMEQEAWKREGDIVQKLLDDISGKSLEKKTDEQTHLHVEEMAEKLHVRKRIVRLEGYREFFFLLVNFVAWYGYGMCVLVYYWPDETQQPTWLRMVLAYGENHLMDWRGNFAGDFMWTIEPLVILGSPMYLAHLQRTIRIIKRQSPKKKTE